MTPSSVSELLNIYLDGNSNESPELLDAESKLLQLGPSVIPALVDGLRSQLKEYRSYTKSTSELRAFSEKIIGILDDERDDPMSLALKERQKEVERGGDGPGISNLQRLVSNASLLRATNLVEKLGTSCDQILCSNLYGSDLSATLSASLILFNLQKPSPYVTKAIVAARYLYIDMPFLSPPFVIVFYLLLCTLTHTGDEFSRYLLDEDLRENSVNLDDFSNYIQDMAIYFISVS